MIIQSRDISLPVLLFLHGGPGDAGVFLNTTHPTGLEQDFTMVWWKQRGSGLSFSPAIPPQGISTTQVASLRPDLATLLRMPGRRPDLVMRFGRGPAMPYSARRPVDAVMVRQGIGRCRIKRSCWPLVDLAFSGDSETRK